MDDICTVCGEPARFFTITGVEPGIESKSIRATFEMRCQLCREKSSQLLEHGSD